MKSLLLSIVFISLSFTGFTQVGLSAVYSTFSSSGWDDVKSGEDIRGFDPNFAYGIDYWFRLKDYRVEFLPELSYAQFDNIIDGETLVPQTMQANLDIFAFSFNTHLYIFDLEGDCNCPTWGKEGGVFKKGFFLMAGPGVAFFSHDDLIGADPVSSTVIRSESNSTRFTFAAGLGLDIGITKEITLTPFGRFKWYSSGTWEALEIVATQNENQDNYPDFDSSVTQLQAGLRLAYRWGQ